MSRRRVLAISQQLDLLRRIVAKLEQAGAEVDALRSVDALATDRISHRFIFAAAEEGDVASTGQLLKLVGPEAHLAVVTPRATLAEITELVRDHRSNHVIVGEELERGVFITAQKLLTGDIFGIEKYVPEGTEIHYLRIRDFDGRTKVIDTVLDFAEASKMRRQVRGAIGQVCEELLMNALYDAPVDDHGEPLFEAVDPHQRQSVRSPRPVSIRYAATETQFLVAVRDRYGRLTKDKVLAYLDKCLHAPVQIDRKTYGAGLGLYLVANAAASLVINVATGIATEVVCSFDRGAKSPLRLFGVFSHPGVETPPKARVDG